jgi:hypothetical protein
MLLNIGFWNLFGIWSLEFGIFITSINLTVKDYK